MLLHVYRLRQSGSRVDRLTLRQRPGLLGEFVYERGPHEFWGKRPMFARLLEPGTARELIPRLEQARIVRVRRGLLVVGVEVIVRATKGKGQHYRQSWVCTSQPIAAGDWPPPPRDPVALGFDPADDDAE